MKKRILLYLLLVITTTTINAQNGYNTPDGWQWRNPIKFGGNFTSCKMFDQDNGIAVGDYGIIVKTTDGGATWNQIATTLNYSFKNLQFFSDNTKGIMTSDSAIFTTSDQGDTWQLDAGFSGANIKGVNIVHDTAFVLYNNTNGKSKLAVKAKNATNWTIQQLSRNYNGMNYPFYWKNDYSTQEYNSTGDTIFKYDHYYMYRNLPSSISFYNGIASISAIAQIPNTDTLLITTNYHYTQGTTLNFRFSLIQKQYFNANNNIESQDLNMTSNYNDSLSIKKIVVINNNLFYLFGKNIYRVRYGNLAGIEDLGYVGQVNDVSFIGSQLAIAACNKSRVLLTANSGNLWAPAIDKVSNVNDFDAIDIFNGKYYALSIQNDTATVYKSTDNGKNWAPFFAGICTNCSQASLGYTNAVKKFVVYNDELVFFSTSKQIFSGGTYSLYSIAKSTYPPSMYTSQIIYQNVEVKDFELLGDTIYGIGTSNEFISGSMVEGLFKGQATQYLSKTLVYSGFPAAMNCLNVYNPNIIYVGGAQGKILKTNNAGTDWTDISVAGVKINAIKFTSADTGFVVADAGTFFRTFNGSNTAVTWTPRITNTDDDLGVLKFFNGKDGYILTSQGLLLTHNSGTNFTLSKAPVKLNTGYSIAGVSPFPGGPTMTLSDYPQTGCMLSPTKSLNYFVYGNNENVLTKGTAPSGSSSSNGLLAITEVKDEITIYPNPANEYITLQTVKNEITQVEVYNSLMQRIITHNNSSATANEIKLNITGLKNGVYYVKVYNTKGTATSAKFIVTK